MPHPSSVPEGTQESTPSGGTGADDGPSTHLPSGSIPQPPPPQLARRRGTPSRRAPSHRRAASKRPAGCGACLAMGGREDPGLACAALAAARLRRRTTAVRRNSRIMATLSGGPRLRPPWHGAEPPSREWHGGSRQEPAVKSRRSAPVRSRSAGAYPRPNCSRSRASSASRALRASASVRNAAVVVRSASSAARRAALSS